MALPALLLPALFSGLSIGANAIGARKQDNAIASRLAQERMRQSRLDEEAFALNANARNRYDNIGEQSEARETDLSQLFRDATETPPAREMAALPATSSDIVTSRVGAETDKAKAETADRADRLGAMRGFGDLFGDMARGQSRDAQNVGMIGGFKRGSQGVLPMELEAASQKGANWMMLGDLLNMGAGLTLAPALSAGGGGGLAGLFGGGKMFGGDAWGMTPWR